MNYPEIFIPKEQALELNDFRDMDYYAVENFDLSIELMMENAGFHLAALIAKNAKKSDKIRMGVGNGNNGGGGLVAARRLCAWGYEVCIDLSTEINKALPARQLQRALKFGAVIAELENPDIWIDAYLGFSQRMPLSYELESRLNLANSSNALKVSLDLPTGFVGSESLHYFNASMILTLAASKKILYDLIHTDIYMADLGIPHEVYEMFNTPTPPFEGRGILKLIF